MLSDHEQRTLEELERSYATETFEPLRTSSDRSTPRTRRPPGAVVLLGFLGLALVIAGVAAAALALPTATAIVWSFWRVWSRHRRGGGVALPLTMWSGRRPADSIRQFLRGLVEAE